MQTLYTIGYSGISVEVLAAATQKQRWLVVDTRLMPASRQPQWNKKALTLRLIEGYLHLPALGNVNYKNGGAIAIADAASGVPVVVRRLEVQPVLLLCVCASVWTCHRRVVAELVQAACGCDLVHLAPGQLEALATGHGTPRQLSLW